MLHRDATITTTINPIDTPNQLKGYGYNQIFLPIKYLCNNLMHQICISVHMIHLLKISNDEKLIDCTKIYCKGSLGRSKIWRNRIIVTA